MPWRPRWYRALWLTKRKPARSHCAPRTTSLQTPWSQGQNVKLAARVLGWKVDIFTETRYNEANAIGHGLEQVASVAEVSIEALLAAGYSSLAALREAGDEELSEKLALSSSRISDLRQAINFLAPIVENDPEPSNVKQIPERRAPPRMKTGRLKKR